MRRRLASAAGPRPLDQGGRRCPLYAGQPGYSTKLDRDRDGVACE